MTMRRFEIAQDSMRPTLLPGEEVVAVDDRLPGVGDVVVFPHPHRESFWMVKRLAQSPVPIGAHEGWVLSDNPEATLADSRAFGPLPLSSMWTVIDRLDRSTFAQACELLGSEDESLRAIIDVHGLPEFWEREPGFPTLVWLILEQQVSLESGAEMYRRVHRAAGEVTPEALIGVGEDTLRRIGVTRQKSRYLTDLAETVARGDLDLDVLASRPLPEARRSLLAVRGVGPWTADAYLLSAVRHLDVFPVGDRALQVGTGETVGMAAPPDEAELEILSEPWKPIRAVAARLIWHGYLARRGRAEPVDPTTQHVRGAGA